MYSHHRGRSASHSIHDARQYAWARLVFGPGAPAPRMRPHRGQLPDVYEPELPQRRPLLRRLARLLRGAADFLDPASGRSASSAAGAGQMEGTGL